MTERRPFGIVGMFRSSDAILAAARHLRELGFREIEAYTPFPVEGLDQAMRPRRRVWLPLLMFATGLIGGLWGYFIQWWGEAWSYPINVGGRPYNSWPAFMVSAFEIMLLLAVTGGFLGLLAACRLPLFYHPIFNSTEIERASRDRFILCVEARDPQFQPRLIRPILERLGAEHIEEVWEEVRA
jgi:hypothetical protein